ncbi:MAG: cytochrome bc complex cytochrome b subunit [bacterium]|nr:cytochrome bc complex cytochrome b subunit [bacterium]
MAIEGAPAPEEQPPQNAGEASPVESGSRPGRSRPGRSRPGRARLGRTWALGSVAVLLFGLQVITGFGLTFHYQPTAESAYLDLVDLREVSSLGFLRELHRWGSHALVIAVGLHLFRVFMAGSYRPPRRLNWTLGVVLLLLSFLLAYTGYLLPWDQFAYWAVATASDGLAAPPSGPTLSRFYALHCVVLPLLTALLVVEHLRRARRDDDSAFLTAMRHAEDLEHARRPDNSVGT